MEIGLFIILYFVELIGHEKLGLKFILRCGFLT